jgi:homoserine kinase
MSSDSNKLILTAVGAALGGAAISFAAFNYLQQKKELKESREALMKAYRPSFVSSLLDDIPEQRSSSVILPHNHEEKMRRRIAARVAIEEDNLTPRNSVTVRVPATSANMGPGCEFLSPCAMLSEPTRILSNLCSRFKDDCLGMAVDLWSEVTVSRAEKFEITAEGDGADEIPKDESNFLVVGLKAAFETADKPVPTLKYHVVSRIPYARGLGSSSAAIVAGIIAGLVLAGHRLPCWGSEALLQIAADIEVCFLPKARTPDLSS